ncbi:unnamed protein product [Closterium sp. NIES-54]
MVTTASAHLPRITAPPHLCHASQHHRTSAMHHSTTAPLPRITAPPHLCHASQHHRTSAMPGWDRAYSTASLHVHPGSSGTFPSSRSATCGTTLRISPTCSSTHTCTSSTALSIAPISPLTSSSRPPVLATASLPFPSASLCFFPSPIAISSVARSLFFGGSPTPPSTSSTAHLSPHTSHRTPLTAHLSPHTSHHTPRSRGDHPSGSSLADAHCNALLVAPSRPRRCSHLPHPHFCASPRSDPAHSGRSTHNGFGPNPLLVDIHPTVPPHAPHRPVPRPGGLLSIIPAPGSAQHAEAAGMAAELLSHLALPASPLSLALTALVALLLLRVLLVLHGVGRPHRKRPPGDRLSTLIVLGSGGHTAEMLCLVGALDHGRYSPRCYIAAATDAISLPKARHLEQALAQGAPTSSPSPTSPVPPPSYLSVYRSREVGQSYLTSVLTTIAATLHAMLLVARVRPQLLLCNGPGTCLPICIAVFTLHVLGVQSSSIVFVESVARVEHLSLTGRLLHRVGIVDRFFVQWPHLTTSCKGTHYVGRLM